MNDWAKMLEGLVSGGRSRVDAPEDMLMFAKPFVPADTQLNFEKRVLQPSKYPVLQQQDGSIATHKMAWGEGDGKFQAFPTVIQGEDQQLKELGSREAWAHAMQTGEFRQFDTAQEAEDYARGGYKKQWGSQDPQPSLIEKLQSLSTSQKRSD